MLFCGSRLVWRSPMSAVRDGRLHTPKRTIDEKFMNEPIVVVCLGLFVLLPWTETGCDAVVNLSLVNTRRRLIKQRWTDPFVCRAALNALLKSTNDWLIDWLADWMQPVCVHQPGHRHVPSSWLCLCLSEKSSPLEDIKQATVFQLYIPTRMLTLKVCFFLCCSRLIKQNEIKEYNPINSSSYDLQICMTRGPTGHIPYRSWGISRSLDQRVGINKYTHTIRIWLVPIGVKLSECKAYCACHEHKLKQIVRK